MVELFEENACHQTYNMERGIEAVVNALTKELSVPAADGEELNDNKRNSCAGWN